MTGIATAFTPRVWGNAAVFLASSTVALAAPQAPSCDEAGWRTLLHESFESGALDPAVWQLTAAGDYKERAQNIVLRERDDGAGHELQLMANTLGTDDRTVKFLGTVFRQRLDLRRRHRIDITLDWNDQENGSYLTAGIYLAPTLTTGSPETDSDWLKLEYIGVPPGRNARAVVALRTRRRLELLETEGWPVQQRTGRRIGREHVQMIIDAGSVRVSENARVLYDSDGPVLSFASAYLYLQMSSHSNYGPREVFFDEVVVRESCEE